MKGRIAIKTRKLMLDVVLASPLMENAWSTVADELWESGKTQVSFYSLLFFVFSNV